jgi:hypothetical protein
MTQAEVEKLFKKPGEKRYEVFVKTVAETEEVYALGDEEGNWALIGDDENEDLDILPLFPNPETAAAFRTAAGFDEDDIMVIDLNEMLEWLQEMVEDKMQVAVCPNTEFNGAVVHPDKLIEDLRKELDKYDEDGKKKK